MILQDCLGDLSQQLILLAGSVMSSGRVRSLLWDVPRVIIMTVCIPTVSFIPADGARAVASNQNATQPWRCEKGIDSPGASPLDHRASAHYQHTQLRDPAFVTIPHQRTPLPTTLYTHSLTQSPPTLPPRGAARPLINTISNSHECGFIVALGLSSLS